jgi:hypothetical protein
MLAYQRFTPAVRLCFERRSRPSETVEINNSVYRLAGAATFAAWRRRASAGVPARAAQ